MADNKDLGNPNVGWVAPDTGKTYQAYDNSDPNRFNIVDKDGNVLGHAPYNSTNVTRKNSGEKLYRYGDTGEFMSKKDLYSTYNIKMNDNGDVEVNAPKSFTDSKYYKEQLKPALLELSKAQKLNPNTKFALTSNQNDLRTAQDWIKAQSNDLASMVARHDQINEYKDQIKNEYKADFSDEDAQTAMSATIKNGDFTPNSNDRQVIPDVPEFSYFTNLPGYDKNTHTIDYKTLTDAYSNDKLTDEQIVAIKKAVERRLAQPRGNESHKIDSRYIAELLSFKKYLDNTEASTNFWTGARHAVTDGLTGIFEGVADATTAPTRFVVSAVGGDNSEYNKWKEDLTKNRQLVNKGGDTVAATTAFASNLVTTIAIGNAVSDGAVKLASLGIKAIGDAGKVGTSWFNATRLAQGMQAVLEGNNGVKVINGAVKFLTTSDKAAKAATGLTKFMAEVVVDSVMMNPDLAGRFIRNTDNEEARKYVIEQFVGNLAGVGIGLVAGKAITKFSNTQLGQNLNNRATVGVAKIKNFLNGWTDKAKKLFHLTNDDLVKKANEQKEKLAKIANPTAGQKNKLVRLEKKINIAQANEMEHKATELLSKLKIPSKTFDPEGYKEAMEAFDNISNFKKRLLSNLRDNLENGGKTTFAKITKTDFDPKFKGAYDEMFGDKFTALLKTEDAIGLSKKGAVNLSDIVGVKGARTLNINTNNYIGASVDLAYINSKIDNIADKGLKRLFEERQAQLTERIGNLKKVLGEDLTQKADDFIDVLKKYDEAHGELLTDVLKLRDKETLEKIKESGIFGEDGEDYFRIQRDIDNPNTPFKSDKNKKLGDFQKRVDIANADYEDVVAYRVHDLLNDAQDYARTEYIRQLDDWKFIGVTDRITGEDFKLHNELERTKTMFKNAIDSKTDYTVSNLFLKDFGIEGEETIKKLTGEVFDAKVFDNLVGGVKKNIDEFLSSVMENKSLTSDVLDNIVKVNGATDMADKAKEFFALKAFSEHLTDGVIEKNLDDAISHIAVMGNDKKEVVELVAKQFRDEIDSRLGTLSKELTDKGLTSLVAESGLYDEVKKLADKISDFKQGENVIEVINKAGQHELLSVDPLTASFFNTKISGYTDTYLSKVNRLQSKLFRTGTTVVGGSSYINQWVKDTGNAFVVGGLVPTGKPTKEMIETWGKDVANFLADNDKRVYDALVKKAEQTGTSVAELALKREMDIARVGAGVGTEASLYQFNKAKRFAELQEGTEKAIGKAKESLENAMDSLETLHNQRETFLRSAVTNKAYSDAMKRGYSIQQARIYAEFIGSNATTNFGRQLYHLNQLQQSVPYLGAAINGAKSFWRVAALDPVGVSSRLMGGVILPTWFLMAQSLGSEENRKVYEQIPEYEKRSGLVFVSHGRKYSIPLPEEIGKLIAPARQAIESLYGANKHTFWELAMNDLVGLSPIDMTGFTNIDRNRLIDNGFIGDHIVPGISHVISQTMPPLVRTSVEVATGKDLYTGKPLDTSYTTIDPDTNEPIVMDSKTGGLAKAISGLFGGNVAPGMAQKVLSNIFGSAGMDIIDGLTDLAKSVVKGDAGNGAEKFIGRIGDQFTSPILSKNYDRTQSLFKQAVSSLSNEKDVLLARKDLQAINNQLRYETDPDKIQKLKNQRDNIINPFYQKVLNVANNLKTQYGATITRQRFASILALMNLENNKGSAYTGNNGYVDELTAKAQAQGKANALETMQRLGFRGADDNSIFGYQKKNKDGEVVTFYQNPVSILSWNSTNWLQDDIHSANIQKTFKDKGMFEKKKAIKEQVDALYADWKKKSKKQKNTDQEKIDNIWINWNAEVMKEIAPYVAKYGAEETINNTKVMTELAQQIELPSEYKSNNKGRKVYGATLGDDGSVKDAYIKSYIRRIFNVNNTEYDGGKDYSGRNK